MVFRDESGKAIIPPKGNPIKKVEEKEKKSSGRSMLDYYQPIPGGPIIAPGGDVVDSDDITGPPPSSGGSGSSGGSSGGGSTLPVGDIPSPPSYAPTPVNPIRNPSLYLQSQGITPEVIEESRYAPSPVTNKINYGMYQTDVKRQQSFTSDIRYVDASKNIPFHPPYLPIMPSGEYYTSNNQFHYISPELKYIITKSDPKESSKLISSIGESTTFFETNFFKAYESLTHEEKTEYGYTYAPFKDEPIEEWKYHPGGVEYLEKNKDDSIDKYIQSMGGYKNFGKNLTSEELISLSRKYATVGGAWSDIELTDKKFIKEYTWDILSLTSKQQKEKYFKDLPAPARWYSSAFHATVTAASFPITLPQMGVKLATGSGDFFERLESGKPLFLPDVGKTIERYQPGGPRGIITASVGTGISYLVGRESDEFDKFMKDPVSGAFATGGELFGMLVGGKIASDIKVTGLKGMGFFRSAVGKYGVNLPSYAQISFWSPTRMFRRWWVQRGTSNIDDVIGTPYHNIDTLDKGGLSFAKGSTPKQRITWTVDKTKQSWDLPLSDDAYLLGSASGERIGTSFVIDPKVLHELPALSTTPYGYAPTRFYRFGPNLNYSSSFSILPKLHLPSAFTIPIKRLYKGIGGSYDDIAQWGVSQPKGSWGAIGYKMALGGPETEINIFGKTVLNRYLQSGSKNIWNRLRGYEYYTDVPLGEFGYLSGKPLIEKVPVVFTRPVHTGYPISGSLLLDENIGSKSILSSFRSNILGSSYNLPSIPLINPSYIFSSALTSVSIPSSSNIFSYSPPSFPSSISIPSYGSYPSYSSLYSKASSYIGSGSSYPSSGSSIVGSGYSPPPPSSYTPPPSSYSPPPPSYYSPPPPSDEWIVYPIMIPKSNPIKKINKMIEKSIGTGYRFRRWKVPSLEDSFDMSGIKSMLKGGIS